MSQIEDINVEKEISASFLDYSMSVIVSRALPDVRDGFKPSQRRILFAMHELGLEPNKKHMKCARIVGETMGKYHPHGDMAIYPTLVHMAQPWAMRDILIEGQGNFGSPEGDEPASMRYTEAKLESLGSVCMNDMEMDTVDLVPNYDGSMLEPTVFPAAFPNLLVNGGTGIAVGMATNIPPHNLGEVIESVCAQIDNPAITSLELMKYVKGPDFPTGCTICGVDGIRKYIETGKGSMRVRGKLSVEQGKGGKEMIVITETPYGVNRGLLVQRIAELANEKIIQGVANVRDESNKNTRIVVELRKEGIPRVIIGALYQHTAIETSFSASMLAIDRLKPKLLSLKEANACYIDHRREVILRRTKYLLREAERRGERLEGFLIALAEIDTILPIIRSAKTKDEARAGLGALKFSKEKAVSFGVIWREHHGAEYKFSLKQIEEILELKLYQLTGLEKDKILAEYITIMEEIKEYLDIIASEARVLQIIKDELNIIKNKYATPRKTEIVPDEGEIRIEDLIANEACVITISHQGYIKRTNASEYRAQRRGGRGVSGMGTRDGDEGKDDDFVEHLFTATTHDYLMFMTKKGRCYIERVHLIPEGARASKGRAIANFLELQSGEQISSTIRIQGKEVNGEDVTWKEGCVVFATKNGIVKKSSLIDFENIRKGGIIAIQIEEGDELIEADFAKLGDEVVLVTKSGMSIRFNEDEMRAQGRNTVGVYGIKLEDKDSVVGMALVDNKATLLVVGENGVGKRTSFEEYRVQSRGGKGVITMKTGEKTGEIVGVITVTDSDDIVLITNGGQMVRLAAKDVRETGRNAVGVKLINLKDGEKLQDIAAVPIGESDESVVATEAVVGQIDNAVLPELPVVTESPEVA